MDSSFTQAGSQANAVERRRAIEVTPLPARSKTVSRDTNREQAIAIIPEMRWEDLSDEALIARYALRRTRAQRNST